ncbi:probable histone-lysine N-methyltransferase set-23 [Periplaneta americana]|uniref:probable histone-lysine N-methyltransferase set-23 n=1 Tax=Periplaneta americana TaxID=6978 RepID=UPI0037E861AE
MLSRANNEYCASSVEDDIMDDDYNHISPDVFYTVTSLPGPGINVDDFNTPFVRGCDCREGKCLHPNCPCVERYGINYSDDGRLLDSKLNGPVVECNSLCGCCVLQRCGNRLVQLGPRKGLQVFKSGDAKGFGLKSKTRISKGEFICEYAGEVISLEEARCRVQTNKGKMNYIFVLNEHLAEGRVIKTYVDPTMIGNIGRYINHSCQPNAVVVPVRTNNLIPKLCIFALTVIEIGEEITFDYSGGGSSGKGEECSVEVELRDRKLCYCGMQDCKKYLPYDETLF